MTAATLTLTEFLLARIAEDETTAREAISGPWQAWIEGRDGHGGDDVILTGATDIYLNFGYHGVAFDGTYDHIARNDPARVLAECEAKRRIVEACADYDSNWHGDLDLADAAVVMEAALFALATVYADHPDYRDEWRI